MTPGWSCCTFPNQIDRLFQWQSNPHSDVRNTINKQKQNTKIEFEERAQLVIVQLAEQVGCSRFSNIMTQWSPTSGFLLFAYFSAVWFVSTAPKSISSLLEWRFHQATLWRSGSSNKKNLQMCLSGFECCAVLRQQEPERIHFPGANLRAHRRRHGQLDRTDLWAQSDYAGKENILLGRTSGERNLQSLSRSERDVQQVWSRLSCFYVSAVSVTQPFCVTWILTTSSFL